MKVSNPSRAAIGLAVAMALGACASDSQVARTSSAAAPHPVSGGGVREGGSIASMADQYGHARPGPVAATGASAWVPPAPPPAFVARGPAPAPAASPPPATPPARPAASPVDIVRPEAAQPEPPAPAPAPAAAPARLSAANLAKARQLFLDQSCGACHALADAGSSGGVGPSLDRNPNLSRAHIVTTVKEGRGPMPGFAAAIEEADIGLLADYIRQVSLK